MEGSSLKAEVLRKHRGKTVKQAFLDEFEQETDPERRADLAKSAPGGSVEQVGFEITAEGSVGALAKSADDYVIWGPASVEVVDKENDRIEASALEEALPQLMKRSSLSYEHSDQIVGEILDKYETEEPVEVRIGDQTFKRDTFPTDVLDLEGMEPALYVAGNVYADTTKSREVRDAIDEGEIRSYSISGEAVVSSITNESGDLVTDISKLDLSAVTLCREGMNQMAKFGVVEKLDPTETTPDQRAVAKSAGGSDDAVGSDEAASIIKDRTMGDDSNNDPLTKSGMEDILDKHLPDGQIPTMEDVEETIDKRLDEFEKAQEDSPTEGTPERPSGDDSSGGVETDPEYSGDNPDETASDSDKVEEKSGAITMKELEEALPADQYKAIKPTLEAADLGGEEEPDAEPSIDEPDDGPDPSETIDPDDDPMGDDDEGLDDEELEVKAKSLGLDVEELNASQRAAIAKADTTALDTVGGAQAPLGKSDGNALDELDADENTLEKAQTAPSGSNFFDGDGGVKL